MASPVTVAVNVASHALVSTALMAVAAVFMSEPLSRALQSKKMSESTLKHVLWYHDLQYCYCDSLLGLRGVCVTLCLLTHTIKIVTCLS